MNSFRLVSEDWWPHCEGYLRHLKSVRKGLRTFQPVAQFWRWLGEQELSPFKLKEQHFYKYAHALKDGGLCHDVSSYAPSTLAEHLGSAKRWMRYLYKSGVILQDPFAGVSPCYPKKSIFRSTLSVYKVKRILNSPDLSTPIGLRDQAIFEVVYGSGLRAGETASLTLESVDLKQRQVHLKNTKNGWDRTVPLTPQACGSITRYLRWGRYELTGPQTGKKLWLTSRHRAATANTMTSIATAYSSKVGFKFTMHGLRHTCATHLLEGGASISQIAALLGHSDLESTRHYTMARFKVLCEVYDRTHPSAQEHQPG